MGVQTSSCEAEIAAVLREAGSARRSVAIRGGGTRGPDVPADTVLSTTGLSGITLYEPGALTLVAASGTPLAEIESALAAEGQQLPFEPWDACALLGREGRSTIGGVVATNASGPRRLQVGACRDSAIGVRFVDGAGTIIKNGGRVMKNVTGLDLVKLMAGSHGTLGVLTEIGLKVLPRPETTLSLVFEGLDAATAGRLMTSALSTPFEVSGAAHLPAGLAAEGTATVLRLEGFAGSVAYRAGALARALAQFGSPSQSTDAELWPAIRDVRAFAGREGAVWRISVKPTDGPVLGARLTEAEILYDWAGGLLWVLTPEDTDPRAAMAGIPGHATLIRAGAAARARFGTFHPEPAPLAALAAGLRAKFDPAGILNPGIMGAPAPVPA